MWTVKFKSCQNSFFDSYYALLPNYNLVIAQVVSSLSFSFWTGKLCPNLTSAGFNHLSFNSVQFFYTTKEKHFQQHDLAILMFYIVLSVLTLCHSIVHVCQKFTFLLHLIMIRAHSSICLPFIRNLVKMAGGNTFPWFSNLVTHSSIEDWFSECRLIQSTGSLHLL